MSQSTGPLTGIYRSSASVRNFLRGRVRGPLPKHPDGAGVLRRRAGSTPAGHGRPRRRADRKSVREGKRVSVRVDLGGRRIIKKQIQTYVHAALLTKKQ